MSSCPACYSLSLWTLWREISGWKSIPRGSVFPGRYFGFQKNYLPNPLPASALLSTGCFSSLASVLETSEKFYMQAHSYVWILLFHQNAKRDMRWFSPTLCLLKFINCLGYHRITTHCFPSLSVMEFFHVNVPHFI